MLCWHLSSYHQGTVYGTHGLLTKKERSSWRQKPNYEKYCKCSLGKQPWGSLALAVSTFTLVHQLALPANAVASSQYYPQSALTLAGILDIFASQPDDAPSMPFAISGQTRKKYLIERMEGEKILSRKQGITTVTCVGGRPLPGEASFPADQFQVCRKAEASEVGLACAQSCQSACKGGVESFLQYSQRFLGFSLPEKEEGKIVRSCTQRCIYECKKPADMYQFEVTNRR